MDHLESFIAECDRRTELAKKRLAETQEEISAEVSAKVCLGLSLRAVCVAHCVVKTSLPAGSQHHYSYCQH